MRKDISDEVFIAIFLRWFLINERGRTVGIGSEHWERQGSPNCGCPIGEKEKAADQTERHTQWKEAITNGNGYDDGMEREK